MAIKTRALKVSNRKQLLSVEDMTAGLDLRRAQTLLGSNRARQLKNWSLSSPGELTVRPGYTAVSSATFGANPQGGERVYLSSNRVFTVMALDGAIYKPTDGWVKGSAVFSTVSSANQVFFPFDRDIVAFMDGAARPRCSTDGSTWVLDGIDAGTAGPTLSTTSTGNLSSGEFAVAYTYKYSGTGIESNGSTESTKTIAATTNGALTVTVPDSTDPKVDRYVVYARHKTPDLESVLRKVSSGASSVFTITSSAWTSNDEIPTNHNAPVAGLRFATVWKNRWWAADGTVRNRLRFTEIFQAQSWPTTFYIDIPFLKGDELSAVQPLGDTLLVHGQNGIFLIIGQTSLDFEVRPSAGADSGAFGQRAVARIEQAASHTSADDVGSFDGATDRSLAFDIQPAIRDLVGHTASTGLARVASVYDFLRKEYRISLPRTYPTAAPGEYILNLDRMREAEGTPAWTTTDRDIAFYIHWSGNEATAGDRGRIFSIPSSGGFVYEEAVGTTANGSNMTATYEGPAMNLGLRSGRFCDLHVEYEPHSGALTVETTVDGVSQGGIALSIGSGLARYGTGTYGTSLYGGAGRKKAYTVLPLTAEGRTAVLTATYTGQEAFKLFTYTYGIVPDPQPIQFSE